jgi:hypothetical protein
MDSCVEVGEQKRFFLDSRCSRWKRQFQSCLVEAQTRQVPDDFCNGTVARLSSCVREACASVEGAASTGA